MQFDEFMKYVTENIKKYLPKEYEDARVTIEHPTKNNNITLNALCIVGKHNVVPSIYLEQFYVHHLFGVPMNQIMRGIAETYLEYQRPEIHMTEEDFVYEKVKDKICVTVCNAEKNQKLLQSVPHELREDLALLYRVRIDVPNCGSGTILIHKTHLEMWGIDENTLKEQAWHNMEHQFPYKLTNVHDQIEEEYDVSKLPGYTRNLEMYMLSNPERMQGAAYMFDKKAMEDIAKSLLRICWYFRYLYMNASS